MNRTEILSKLKEIVEEQLEKTVDITEDTALLGEKILDSMEFMSYLTTVEETFGISISDDDIATHQLGIVGNMVEYLVSE